MAANIVFIDPRVLNWQSLVADLPPDNIWRLLDEHSDGVAQMQAFLAGYRDLASIQIISHGSAGAFYIGSSAVNAASLSSYSSQWAAIGSALSETGDLLLYGCDVAAGGESGEALIRQIAALTGADVAASTDKTGAAALGGDWVLEAQTGAIEAPTVIAADYQYDLSASGDEAGLGFSVDAPYSLTTSFYLLIGDNAYGYSFAATNVGLGIIGDVDVYALNLNPGYTYTVVTTSSTAPVYSPGVQTSFDLVDALNNLVGVSVNYGTYSGLTFTATQSRYFVETYSSSIGFYGMRVVNNSVPEANGIGETLAAGVVTSAALDYASDSDHFLFTGIAGHTYAVTIATAVPDLFLKIYNINTNLYANWVVGGVAFIRSRPV